MQIETRTFTSDNLKLRGEIYIPEKNGHKYPAVCMCHGISAGPYNPEERSWPQLAEKFCLAGFITMIFNFRGAGLSQGNFDIQGWTRDLAAALDLLFNVQEVERQRVFLLGSSAGASVSIYVAAHDSRISGLVSLACPSTFSFINGEQVEEALQHFRKVGIIKDKDFPPSIEEWLDNFTAVAPVRWVHKVAPRSLLIMHGDQDEVVPVEQAYQLYALAHEPKEIIIIPGAGHRLRLADSAVDLSLSWLKKQATLIR